MKLETNLGKNTSVFRLGLLQCIGVDSEFSPLSLNCENLTAKEGKVFKCLKVLLVVPMECKALDLGSGLVIDVRDIRI